MNNNPKEIKQASASYILTFQQNVATLAHHFALYANFLLEIEVKHKGKDKKDLASALEEGDKTNIKQLSQNVRYYAKMTYYQYKSISEKLKADKKIASDDKTQENIEKTYGELNKQLIVEDANAEAYVIGLNSFLINNTLQDLLESSADVINQLYGESQHGNTS